MRTLQVYVTSSESMLGFGYRNRHIVDLCAHLGVELELVSWSGHARVLPTKGRVLVEITEFMDVTAVLEACEKFGHLPINHASLVKKCEGGGVRGGSAVVTLFYFLINNNIIPQREYHEHLQRKRHGYKISYKPGPRRDPERTPVPATGLT
jgi:hypothetical protein